MCFFLVYLTMQDEFHLGKEGVGGVQQFQPGLCMNRGLSQIYGSPPAVQWLLGSGRFYSLSLHMVGFFVCLFVLPFLFFAALPRYRKEAHSCHSSRNCTGDSGLYEHEHLSHHQSGCRHAPISLGSFLSCILGQTHCFPKTLVNLSEQLRDMAAIQIKLCWRAVTKF